VRGLRRRPGVNKALWLFRNIFQARAERRCHGVTSRVVRRGESVSNVVRLFHHGSQWPVRAIRTQWWKLIPHARLSTRVRRECARLFFRIFGGVVDRIEGLTRGHTRRRVCRLCVAMGPRTNAWSRKALDRAHGAKSWPELILLRRTILLLIGHARAHGR
jgi:hypothetical protein